jgi:hypothetical protein
MSFHSLGATWHVIYSATWHGLNLAYVPRGMARLSLATMAWHSLTKVIQIFEHLRSFQNNNNNNNLNNQILKHKVTPHLSSILTKIVAF